MTRDILGSGAWVVTAALVISTGCEQPSPIVATSDSGTATIAPADPTSMQKQLKPADCATVRTLSEPANVFRLGTPPDEFYELHVPVAIDVACEELLYISVRITSRIGQRQWVVDELLRAPAVGTTEHTWQHSESGLWFRPMVIRLPRNVGVEMHNLRNQRVVVTFLVTAAEFRNGLTVRGSGAA